MEGSRLPPEIERTLATQTEGPVVERAPHKEPETPLEWVKENLFSSPFNSVLTVVVGLFVGYVGFGLLRWLFGPAEFAVARANFRVYMIGRFPLEEAWRIWTSAYLVAVLAGLSWGMSGKRVTWTRTRAIMSALLGAAAVFVLGYLVQTLRARVLTLGIVAALVAGMYLGRVAGPRIRRLVIAGWVAIFPVVYVILAWFGGVPSEKWGGFMVNLLLAFAAIFLSFPFGVLLALGRRSSLQAVSKFCVVFIEFFRGVPLLTLIISSEYLLPLLLPESLVLTRIVRLTIAFTIFSAVYYAEIVRGGLQGVHAGQYEAANALGLSTMKMNRLIVLPQALRSTIPATISHFISLFKDTTLIAALAILEILRAANRAAAQFKFIGHKKEALIVAALLLWLVAFSMSRWSQRLERRLGVGER